MSDFFQGVIVGGFLGALVGCLTMALAVSASRADRRTEREQYSDRVKANRRAAAMDPHRLQIMRARYDQDQQDN
jgi:hypothetical protein